MWQEAKHGAPVKHLDAAPLQTKKKASTGTLHMYFKDFFFIKLKKKSKIT